jgi:hypothetical protein
MKNLASAVFDYKETIQNSKGESWYGEEIHGSDDIPMITQERSPKFAFLVRRRQAIIVSHSLLSP